MRSLLGSNREPLSNARIAKAVRSIGIKEAAGEIQRFVVEGKTIELPGDIWGTCAAEFKDHFASSTWASTGLNRNGPRSSRVRSRTAMPGAPVFGMGRSGRLSMLEWVIRRPGRD